MGETLEKCANRISIGQSPWTIGLRLILEGQNTKRKGQNGQRPRAWIKLMRILGRYSKKHGYQIGVGIEA